MKLATQLEPTIWLSPVDKCDICNGQIKDEFSDAPIGGRGPWGIICPPCAKVGVTGYGTGKGQRYQLQPYGDKQAWLKVEG